MPMITQKHVLYVMAGMITLMFLYPPQFSDFMGERGLLYYYWVSSNSDIAYGRLMFQIAGVLLIGGLVYKAQPAE
jgi:hypothetical protein